jgi:hypothetical protein
MSRREDRYCIIGGGSAGIGAAKSLQENHIPFDLVEREGDLGGLWDYSGQGSRVYESTHLISSRNNTQFGDFPMPADYPHYPNHRLYLSYLRSLARRYGIYDRATFGASVERLSPEGPGWEVALSSGETRYYRGVIVANGLLREPRLPDDPGRFGGTVLHSSRYRSADVFRDKRVLVVGSGNSGCDIAVDAAHVARQTLHSARRGYHYMPKFIAGQPTQEWLMEISPGFGSPEEYWSHVKSVFKLAGYDGEDYGLPRPDHRIEQAHPIMNSQVLYHIGHGDIVPKPGVKLLKERSVVFEDGSEAEVEVLVYATGYRVSLPFLAPGIVDWEQGMAGMFLNAIPREYDNLIFSGYINSPSGFGNLANAAGRFLVAYLKAQEARSRSWRVLGELKTRWRELDLGQDNYVKTERHRHEVDLWKYVKTLNFLRAKLEAAA